MVQAQLPIQITHLDNAGMRLNHLINQGEPLCAGTQGLQRHLSELHELRALLAAQGVEVFEQFGPRRFEPLQHLIGGQAQGQGLGTRLEDHGGGVALERVQCGPNLGDLRAFSASFEARGDQTVEQTLRRQR